MLPISRSLLVSLAIIFPVVAADRPANIADNLAVQEAIRQGRELLTQNQTAKAVDLLEKQLGKSQGDPAFLALLRQAYTAYLKELQLANKSETYEIYRKRLAIINREPGNQPKQSKPKDIVRGVSADEESIPERVGGADGLVRADQAFRAQRYSEARELFKQAHQNGVSLNSEQLSQFAYCSMHEVVARLNAGHVPASLLEKEAKASMALAPDNTELAKFGRQVLQEIAARERSNPTGAFVKVKHGEVNGWKSAETVNFRLFHRNDQEYAEQFLNLAEQARSMAFSKWASPTAIAWKPICDIYLYPRGEEYSKATQQPATSPGHSTMKCSGGKVSSRRMDLRADDINLLGSTLPHEITHVVLADLFADMTLPRWADEGMAVLAEPRSQIDRYLKTMVRLRSEGRLIPLAQIVGQSEYPEAKAITVFYVESVSVVEFMVNLKGPAVFVSFVRESARGLDAALQKHYAIRNIADLQAHWLRATFTEIDRANGVAVGGQ